jgi:16S rRNA (cytosine967-C5)-methyltransferase
MSVTGSQQQTFLRLLAALQPHWRNDPHLPARIQALLSRNRAFGSRDRRLYRELIYTTLRYLPWIEPLLDHESARAVETVAWLASDTPAAQAFRAALAGAWPPCPASVAEKAGILANKVAADLRAAAASSESNNPPPGGRRPPLPSLLPDWFREHCPEAFEPAQMDVLLARAPLWLRLQTADPGEVFSEFDTRGWTWRRSEVLPSAVELRPEADVTGSDAYQRGLVEVQDLGSQMILASVGLEPGGHWLDACAGAGGKTLQLAALLGPTGRIDAHDIRAAALAELKVRAERAGAVVASAISIVSRPAEAYDGVLVDAPCSGSGTWRRAPHLKWTTTPAQVEAAARQQLELLTTFSRHVRPGGRLVYATCSLSHRENEDVVAEFLAAEADFAPTPLAATFGFTPGPAGMTLMPARHDTDGFFVASMRRK